MEENVYTTPDNDPFTTRMIYTRYIKLSHGVF